MGVPGASQVALVVKNPPANAGDVREVGLIPESGRSPGAGPRSPLQYSCLENPMDRGSWWAIHGVAKSGTQLKWLNMRAPSGDVQETAGCVHQNSGYHTDLRVNHYDAPQELCITLRKQLPKTVPVVARSCLTMIPWTAARQVSLSRKQLFKGLIGKEMAMGLLESHWDPTPKFSFSQLIWLAALLVVTHPVQDNRVALIECTLTWWTEAHLDL